MKKTTLFIGCLFTGAFVALFIAYALGHVLWGQWAHLGAMLGTFTVGTSILITYAKGGK